MATVISMCRRPQDLFKPRRQFQTTQLFFKLCGGLKKVAPTSEYSVLEAQTLQGGWSWVYKGLGSKKPEVERT